MTVTAPRWIEDKVWYAAEASLKLNIVLPEPPQRCDCERVPLCLVLHTFVFYSPNHFPYQKVTDGRQKH